MRWRRGAALAVAVTVLAGACSDDDDDRPVTGPSTSGAPTTTAPAPGGTGSTTVAPGPVTTEGGPTTSLGSGGPGVDVPGDPAAVEELPELVELIEEAVGDPAADPLALARRVIGFPLALPAPEASVFHGVRLDGERDLDDDEIEWTFTYRVVTTGTVPDVDQEAETAPGGGAATEHLAALFDPVLGDLGFSRSTDTVSTQVAGDFHAVGLTWAPDERSVTVNGVTGEVTAVRVWLEEDVTDGYFLDGVEPAPGYRFDYRMLAPPDAGPPAPLLAGAVAALPVPDAAQLLEARFDLGHRVRGSSGTDPVRELELELEWEAPGVGHDALVALYGSAASFPRPDLVGPDGSLDEDDDELRLDLVLLDRWEGRLEVQIEEPDEDEGPDDVGPAEIAVEFDLDPAA